MVTVSRLFGDAGATGVNPATIRLMPIPANKNNFLVATITAINQSKLESIKVNSRLLL